RGPDFDAQLRFYAVAGDRPVGYVTCQANGRVSYPWCRHGHESQAEPMFDQAISTLKQRGVKRAFAAYRADWPVQRAFLEGHGFKQTREIINYVLDLTEMPTPGAGTSANISPLTGADMPAVPDLGKGIFRTADVSVLTQHFLQNPYYPADAVFAYRGRAGGA